MEAQEAQGQEAVSGRREALQAQGQEAEVAGTRPREGPGSRGTPGYLCPDALLEARRPDTRAATPRSRGDRQRHRRLDVRGRAQRHARAGGRRRGARWPRRASTCSTSAPSRRAAARRCPPRGGGRAAGARDRGPGASGPACRSRPTPSRPRSPRRALDAGAVAINDISGARDGDVRAGRRQRLRLVLMHIEGPPREDRARAALRRPRRPPEGLVRRADRGGAPRAGSPRSRSRSTPASTSTSASPTASRSCAGSASCASSAARSTSRSPARTCSARCSPAPGRSGCRAERARVGDGRGDGARGAQGGAIPASTTAARCRRCGSPARSRG